MQGHYYLKVSGQRGPAVAHKTIAEAYTEARRLYELHNGQIRVRVLQQIGTIEPKAKS